MDKRIAAEITCVDSSEVVIRGITTQGRSFRPSDWADRLAGLASQVGSDNRLNYCPLVQPVTRAGIRCVVINRALETLGACRALGVGAPVPIFAQGKARRSAVWSFQTSEPQHRHGQKAAPALRVGRLGGVCGVVSLGHGTTMACATRLASIRPNTQRIPRPKPNRLLDSRMFRFLLDFARDNDLEVVDGRQKPLD